MKFNEVMEKLNNMVDPKAVEGMKRFKIGSIKTLGIKIPVLKKLAKEIGIDHKLAQELWKEEVREARVLAGFIGDSKEVTEKMMDNWVKDFSDWEICDQVCGSLFDRTPFAFKKVEEWAKREEEFVKRAAFAIVAWSTMHNKKAEDSDFIKFFPIIKREAIDERNFVKKAVNWALRQIGKKNLNLNKEAIKIAKEIQNMDSKSAKWIAADALRELQSEAVQTRLKKKKI